MTAPAVIHLDDLLLDAQHELEECECPRLAAAVATARLRLVHDSIDVAFEDDPDAVAPMPTERVG